jgi:hypothetical protein
LGLTETQCRSLGGIWNSNSNTPCTLTPTASATGLTNEQCNDIKDARWSNNQCIITPQGIDSKQCEDQLGGEWDPDANPPCKLQTANTLTEQQCRSLEGYDWIDNTCKIKNQDLSITRVQCEDQLGGEWNDTDKKCILKDSSALTDEQCKKLGGTLVGVTPDSRGICIPTTLLTEIGDLKKAKCDIEKQAFFQTKVPDAEHIICDKRYKIIFKRQFFSQDTSTSVLIPSPLSGTIYTSINDIPNYSNIIQNSLTLHLLGAGGGGGCGGSAPSWGHGGYAGEKSVIPLDAVNIKQGDMMVIDVGGGGRGGGSSGTCTSGGHLALRGGNTSVTLYGKVQLHNYLTKIQTTVYARGGDPGANQYTTESSAVSVKFSDDFGCTGEPSSFFVNQDFYPNGVGSSGGTCSYILRRTPGGLGGPGSGGGGGYNNDGGKGGDGAVALTWLECLNLNNPNESCN